MALIDINLNPEKSELKWFGLLLLVFFGLLGGIIFWINSESAVPPILWSVGLSVCVIYYAVKPLRLTLYRVWMKLVFPLGWAISHLLFGIIYYLVLTPVGLLLRLFRYDPLRRRRDENAQTYWSEHGSETDPGKYFKQF
jgi:hypothetical protein